MKTKGLEGKSNIGIQRGIHEPQSPWSGRMVKFVWLGQRLQSLRSFDFTLSDGSSGLAHLFIRSS